MTKALVKITIAVTICFMITTCWMIISPILANNIAMGQMTNSDLGFMTMETFTRLNSFISLAEIIIGACFGASAAFDIYEYFKYKENN